jgi:hypothetical protein
MSPPPTSMPPTPSPSPSKPASGMEGGRRKTAWMSHVKATMRANKGLKLKQVLKLAKKTYKKMAKRGGGQVLQPNIVGGRRRKTRRSRRGGNYDL